MDIFEFSDYKAFTTHWVRAQSNKGRGQYKRMAEYLGLSTVQISQVFKADRDLTPDQGFLLADYFNLTSIERDYFLLLITINRASTHTYKEHLKAELKNLVAKSKSLKTRVPQDAELSKEVQAEFYSDWAYTAVRLLISCESIEGVDDVAQRLKIPKPRIKQIIEFLLQHSLIVLEEGKLELGPARIHLDKKSPLAQSRRLAWRMKAIEAMNGEFFDESIHSTLLMTISDKDYEKFKSKVQALINDFYKDIPNSPAEDLFCLSLDFFRMDFR